MFKVPDGLDLQNAQQIRTTLPTAPKCRDYRERTMFAQFATHRLCSHKFKKDGILLPFGQTRELFDTSNPSENYNVVSPRKADNDINTIF